MDSFISNTSDSSRIVSDNLANMNEPTSFTQTHELKHKWTMYAHLPHDTDWSIESYKPIMKTKSLEELMLLCHNINESLVCNCMLFMMKDNIKPVWEDLQNKNGGALCFKIANEYIHEIWNKICFAIAGNSLMNSSELNEKINGITVSPKKNFCILKIWTSDTSLQNIEQMIQIDNLDTNVLFKKHCPEY